MSSERKRLIDWQNQGHPAGHKCFACDQGMDALRKWEDGCMKKGGFFMHYVPLPDGYMNAHTHGFRETWKHPDFQIVIPLPERVVADIFWNFAHRAKAGEQFKAGDSVEKIISGHPIRLIDAKEEGRPVLRVLLPDPKWRYPGEPDCMPTYEAQMTLETDFQSHGRN